jgi:hypothetical protein
MRFSMSRVFLLRGSLVMAFTNTGTPSGTLVIVARTSRASSGLPEWHIVSRLTTAGRNSPASTAAFSTSSQSPSCQCAEGWTRRLARTTLAFRSTPWNCSGFRKPALESCPSSDLGDASWTLHRVQYCRSRGTEGPPRIRLARCTSSTRDRTFWSADLPPNSVMMFLLERPW